MARFVRAKNCRAFRPNYYVAGLLDSNRLPRAAVRVERAVQAFIPVLITMTSSFFTSRTGARDEVPGLGPCLQGETKPCSSTPHRDAGQGMLLALRIFDAATICIALVICAVCESI